MNQNLIKNVLNPIEIGRSVMDQTKLIKNLMNKDKISILLTVAAEILANTKKIVFELLQISRGKNGIQRIKLPEYRNIKINFNEFEDFCNGVCLISEYHEELKNKIMLFLLEKNLTKIEFQRRPKPIDLWPWHLSRHKSRPISIDRYHQVLQKLYWVK